MIDARFFTDVPCHKPVETTLTHLPHLDFRKAATRRLFSSAGSDSCRNQARPVPDLKQCEHPCERCGDGPRPVPKLPVASRRVDRYEGDGIGA